jgi:hypothetical protein
LLEAFLTFSDAAYAHLDRPVLSRLCSGELPLLALVINLALAASWGSGLTGLGKAWPAYLATILSLPIGMLCTAAAFDAYRRERRQRAQRGG